PVMRCGTCQRRGRVGSLSTRLSACLPSTAHTREMAGQGEAFMLDRQRFFIKEQIAFLKTTDVYDIFDPDTQEMVGVAREDPGQLVTFLRWFISKKLMPTRVMITSTETDEVVFTIRKPVSFWRERVEVFDASDKRIGYFKSKIFSLGGGFWVY